MTATSSMLTIKAIDPTARLAISEYTECWYVESRIEISNGTFLTGVTEHRSTPDAAVIAFLDRLQNIGIDEVIVARPFGNRRHYRWNGAAFAEVPIPEPART